MKNRSSWYVTEMTILTHSPFDTCGNGFSSGMGPQSILKEISHLVENSGFLYLPSFLLPDCTFLIYIFRAEKKLQKIQRPDMKKIIVTYFGDKCSILVVFNILIQCIHNFR